MWSECLATGTDVATLACIPIVIKNLINAALAFSGFVALILFIYGGITFMTSRGDEQKLQSAKKTMTYAILGLFLIFFSFFIVGLIAKITGVTQLTNPTL